MGFRKILKMGTTPNPPSNPPPDPSLNPYAQEQQPAGPPPDYNYDQYATNQRIQQPPQGSYGGLPSGPRSGVVPGGVAPGFPTRSASNGPPPPQYPSPGARPPPYGGSEYSPGSAGSTPVIPSTTSSPRLGSGYPKEKFGAQDGVGKPRWETQDTPQSRSPTSLPSQRQGGYGSLDAQSGGLYDNYNGSNRTTNWNPAPSDALYADDGRRPERSEMTEGNGQDAEADDTKVEIIKTQRETEESLDRSLMSAYQGRDNLRNMLAQYAEQEERLDRVEENFVDVDDHIEASREKTKRLAHYNRSLFKPGWGGKKDDQLAAEQAEREVRRLQRRDELRETHQQQRKELEQNLQGSSMRAGEPKTLGKSDNSKYAFEDDDGTQAETLARTDDKINELGSVVGDIHEMSLNMKARTEASLARLPKLAEKAERSRDGIVRNHAAMNRAAGYR